ncbi:MAG: cation diffusion facilitator family transporter [Deltaproteobacteria bacterium]|nr:cation diffusion facilitator family transporter [Deltaproteobacteria bacterium]MBW2166537.1 cation diffusion facilitator family transporter [Deltaproteobacteria bacterium]
MKNSEIHTDDRKNNTLTKEAKQIERVALYALLINFVLTGIKCVLAYFSGSLAVAASAIDSATDSVASLTILGGLKLSTRKSPTFPYGLYKIENVISVIMAIFIFFAGYEIVRNILSPGAKPPTITLGLIGWLSAGILITFLFGQYAISAGKRTKSPTLIAEGRHRQVDVLSSLVVVLAVGLHYFGLNIDFFGITIDHIAAGLVLIFIGYAGWQILSDGMRVLLDASLDPETLEQIRKIIESQPMVTEIRRLAGRNAGRYRFLETEVVLRTGNLKKAYAISQHIEADIRKQIPLVERVVIHYEPQVREHLRIAVPLADTLGHVSAHFGEAPYFAMLLLRLADGNIEQQKVVTNPHTKVPKAKGIRVAEWLVEHKVDVVVVKEDLHKKGPAYVFADAGVELQVSAAGRLSEMIDFFRKQVVVSDQS